MAEKKPFEPSPKRLKDAQKKGNTLKSQMVSQGLLVVGTLVAIWLFAAKALVENEILLECMKIYAIHQSTQCLRGAASLVFRTVGGCLLLGVFLSVSAELLLDRGGFHLGLVKPKMERIDPLGGIKKLWKGVRQLWLKVVFVALMGAVVVWVVWGVFLRLPLWPHSREMMFSVLQRGVATIFLAGSAALLCCALLDYFVQRREYFRELSMSHREMRDELKESEGDPMMRGYRRAEHEALLMQNIEARVRKAKVIVVDFEV